MLGYILWVDIWFGINSHRFCSYSVRIMYAERACVHDCCTEVHILSPGSRSGRPFSTIHCQKIAEILSNPKVMSHDASTFTTTARNLGVEVLVIRHFDSLCGTASRVWRLQDFRSSHRSNFGTCTTIGHEVPRAWLKCVVDCSESERGTCHEDNTVFVCCSTLNVF